jgi:Beta-galactosidase C-terminal domain
MRRAKSTQTWLFARNHLNNDEVKIPLDQPGYEVLSDTKLDTSLRLGPMDVAIIPFINNS